MKMSEESRVINDFYNKTQSVVEQLSEDNRNYFNKIEDDMIFSSFFYNEIQVRELIYGMSMDLLDADRAGMTAEAYFGEEPQKTVKDILKNRQVEKKRTLLKTSLQLVGILWFYRILSDFASHGFIQINLISYLSDSVLSILGIYFLFALLKFSIYHVNQFKLSVKGKSIPIGEFLTYWLGGVVLVGVVLLRLYGDRFYSGFFSFSLSPIMSALIITIIAFIGIAIVIKMTVLKPVSIIIIAQLFVGYLKTAILQGVLTEFSFSEDISLFIILISWVVSIYLIYKQAKYNIAE
ncbi:hypothetical protein [Streptococcus ferus]|uniref:hypothetical protein n=1 Tax=Streptococcus ferus TaxID=1345 RepID=UPI0035A16872